MADGTSFMAAEIAETPQAVARLLDREGATLAAIGRHLRTRDPKVVVTGARGSSDHAAGYFKYLVEILVGTPVSSLGPSIASVYGAPLRLRDAVLVSVSQSGQSPDIVALQAAARAGGTPTVAVVNDAASPLALTADHVVPLHAGTEQSVAATKTCIASAVALAAIVAEWRDDAALRDAVHALPEALERAAAIRWDDALPVFRNATSAYVLGRGPALPIAAEAALKLKETAVLHAEGFSSAEVLHGPLQLLAPGFPVIAFRPRDAADGAMGATVDRIAAIGGRVFVAEPGGSGLAVAATRHWALDPLAMLLTFYGFAEALSRARGHDPDRPSRLSKVTKTV